MGKLNEIYVAVKEIDYVENQIDRLCEKYHNRSCNDYVQQRSLFRSYCNDTLKVFEDCFETSMLGMQRCKAKVKTYQAIDDLEIKSATFDIVTMLFELKDITKTMVPIKDLPSCKKLIELTGEDIASKAKDLIKNDIIKAGVGVCLLGLKVSDVITIHDVKGYYNDRLAQLNSEILQKGKTPSSIELFLLDKFNAEIGYCNLALYKAGIGVTEELKGLAEIGRKHIEKFDNYTLASSCPAQMYL